MGGFGILCWLVYRVFDSFGVVLCGLVVYGCGWVLPCVFLFGLFMGVCAFGFGVVLMC